MLVKCLEKLISKCCMLRFWGFYYLTRLKVDLLYKTSSRAIWLVGKQGRLQIWNDLPKLWCWPKVQRSKKACNSCTPHLRADRNPGNEKNRWSLILFSCTSTGEPLHGVLIICLSRGLQQFIQVSGKVLVFEL